MAFSERKYERCFTGHGNCPRKWFQPPKIYVPVSYATPGSSLQLVEPLQNAWYSK